MYKALSPGAIHVSVKNLDEAIAAAKIGGFEGVEFNPSEVADLIDVNGAEFVRDKFAAAGIKPAGWGLPTERRGEKETFQESLKQLDRLAKASAAIGCHRTATWIMPAGPRVFDENYTFHVNRLSPVAKILADHGIRFGLEFIGPITASRWDKHPFIRTMGGMLDMAGEIGTNVGLLLDAWHWFASDGSMVEIEKLEARKVVYVHVNDAPEGVPLDELQDNDRRLPGQTGVIPIGAFLEALADIGYDGPVIPEPFYSPLKDLASDEERLKLVGQSLDKIFAPS